MKNKILCLAICLLLLVCFTGCAQKTKSFVSLFESVDRTLPSFDLGASRSYMDVDDATMTMYFATDDQHGYCTFGYYRLALYVSNQDRGLYYDRDDRTIADYQNIEGYTLLVEYSDADIDGSQYAIRRTWQNLKYKYSEEITIPTEYLEGEQGTLYFYLCAVDQTGESDTYFVHTCQSIKNIGYENQDGQVKFDFSDYER